MAYITLNRQNLFHNLNQIALKTGSLDKVAIVLKDNAYGHGLAHIAAMAAEFGVKHAVVRNVIEADQINTLFKSILILGDRAVSDEKYSFAINTLEDIEQAQKGARVELKVDTGMHRNGIAIDELTDALEMIRKKGLVLFGVMTHFRAADEMGSALFWQQKRFDAIKAKVKAAGFEGVRFHSHNSAAILRSKYFEEDLVRVGIAAYGYNELPEPFDAVELRPVMKLMAKKVSSRTLQKGERVGYSGDFAAPQKMTVSTYDIGYGDGWCRGDSSHPYVTAEGLPVLGRVSMDFISIESDKEQICVFDNAQEAAKQLGTISYEITTALSPQLERKVVEE